jgi:hypothetical protein
MPLVAPASQVGVVVSISAAAPATEDASGYAALSWTEVGRVQMVPETGDSSEDGTVVTLKDGRVEHFNGARDAGSLVIPYVFVTDDAGQVIVRAGENGSTEHSLKIEDPDGTINYYVGVIGPVRDTVRDTNTHKGQTFEFRTISGRVTA